jgi:hypothetical protein
MGSATCRISARNAREKRREALCDSFKGPWMQQSIDFVFRTSTDDIAATPSADDEAVSSPAAFDEYTRRWHQSMASSPHASNPETRDGPLAPAWRPSEVDGQAGRRAFAQLAESAIFLGSAEAPASALLLSKVRQQRGALIHRDESAIDDETVRRENRR